jgi:hypothetical protein
MPMPPPRPSTEAARDAVLAREITQILRALRSEGAQNAETLALLVGARFWDSGHFERALARAVNDGIVVQTSDARFTAV